MSSAFAAPGGAEPERPLPAMADGDALDAICAVLHTTDCGPDAVADIVRLVRAAGRPYVADLPVIEAYTTTDRHGVPHATVEVDGETAVSVRVDEHGQVRVRLDHATGRPLHLDVGAACPQPPRA